MTHNIFGNKEKYIFNWELNNDAKMFEDKVTANANTSLQDRRGRNRVAMAPKKQPITTETSESHYIASIKSRNQNVLVWRSIEVYFGAILLEFCT